MSAIKISQLALVAMHLTDERCDELDWCYLEQHEDKKHMIALYGPKGGVPEVQVEGDSRCEAWEKLAEAIVGIEMRRNGDT